MKFYVIYEFDCTKNDDPDSYDPPFLQDGWEQTEDDDEWEYDYLADENPHNSDIWRDGHHRKWVHPDLTKEQFLDFVRKTGLMYEDVGTMGSLTGIGWLPAFAFHGESMSIYDNSGLINQTAYVTPIPEPVRPMFSVRHREDQIAIWPMTDEELKTYQLHRQDRYWNMMASAFKNGR